MQTISTIFLVLFCVEFILVRTSKEIYDNCYVFDSIVRLPSLYIGFAHGGRGEALQVFFKKETLKLCLIVDFYVRNSRRKRSVGSFWLPNDK